MINESFVIEGGKKLNGTVHVQTSKNATLPILASTIMVNGKVVIKNPPKITDVDNMFSILKSLGANVEEKKDKVIIDTKNANGSIDCELSKTMRSSVFLLGSTLARFKYTIITSPGGCKIGARPIDIHIKSLQKLGVKVCPLGEFIYFDATKAKAGVVKLKLPSVGATENVMQFASLLKGKTIIKNAAREPEIVDLANFLNKCGAKIKGAGTNKITIYGVDNLFGTHYQPFRDRIVAGSIMVATAICGGKVKIHGAEIEQNKNLINKLCSMGCKIDTKCDILTISSTGKLTNLPKIKTGYYPKFPTDLQSLMLVASCVSSGKTEICEKVFENRFLTLPALKLMGADVKQINAHKVKVVGLDNLKPAEVEALDLRGGASLVILAMAIEGESIVHNIHFIDRGYENFENVLSSLGASIKRI